MRTLSTLFIVIAIVFVVVGSSVFTVYESDRVILSRLGDLRTDKEGMVKVYDPGLHWKMPILDKKHVFDARLQMTEVPSERIVTKEKEVLWVDLFVQWRINNFALFYNTTHGLSEGLGERDRAEQLLRQNVKGMLHAEFGRRSLKNLVSGDRNSLMDELRTRTNENISAYGMKVIDVRINRVEYPSEVNDRVFARMSSERKRMAVYYRATGESEAAAIRADADRQAKIIVAESHKDGELIRGQGDGQAAKIYADNYNKAPEFYRFYHSLEVYRKVFDEKQDVIVLKPDSDFFKYFKNIREQ